MTKSSVILAVGAAISMAGCSINPMRPAPVIASKRVIDVKRIGIVSVIPPNFYGYRIEGSRYQSFFLNLPNLDINTYCENEIKSTLESGASMKVELLAEDRSNIQKELGLIRDGSYSSGGVLNLKKLSPYLDQLRTEKSIDALLIVLPYHAPALGMSDFIKLSNHRIHGCGLYRSVWGEKQADVAYTQVGLALMSAGADRWKYEKMTYASKPIASSKWNLNPTPSEPRILSAETEMEAARVIQELLSDSLAKSIAKWGLIENRGDNER